MGSLVKLYRTLPVRPHPCENQASIQASPAAEKVRIPPRGCSLRLIDSENKPKLILVNPPPPSSVTAAGLQFIAWHLLQYGFARLQSRFSSKRNSVPVGDQLKQDFPNDFGQWWDPRIHEGSSIQLTTMTVDSSFAQSPQTRGLCFVSASVSIRFRGKHKKYDLISRFWIDSALATSVYQLLGQ
ncbi:hypothetical protein SCHPADRAFT_895046 [Schizopora paradoxa]|uniref:Uncharacterized protein n=1 Tax=Schizopora paradoxa TaxID=27342 RepID=A0A0H2R587_9AGAM|nr:hypothetical protein SCHPADRAFT_895046 [Schizopora paradoxa]